MKSSLEPVLYKSTVAYDGTDFKGFQRQTQDQRTVQSTLEHALIELGWQEASIRAAGRTDRGVHAEGQVVAYRLAWAHGTDELTSALNAKLPADVAIRSSEAAPADFDPRFSASGRRYTYQLLVDQIQDPLRERYAWRIWPAPDQALLSEASNQFVGRHDFGAFGRAPIPGGHTVRVVTSAEWRQNGSGPRLSIEADAFLYHMVRRIVSAVLQIAWRRATMEQLQQSLSDPKMAWKGQIAPPHGLRLAAVMYGKRDNASA